MRWELDFSEKRIVAVKEDFKKKVKGDGKRGPFYNKTQSWVFDRDDKTLFRNAVWQAYLDTNRTMTGISGLDKDFGALANFADEVQLFFQKNSGEFTHELWCDNLINDLKEINQYEARYGHAQKIVNMTFKYLYCCSGAEKQWFKDCHMPLDQYTLAWFFTEEGILFQGWSWFNKEKYIEVSNTIKSILKSDILGKELVIWDEFKDKTVELKKIYKEDNRMGNDRTNISDKDGKIDMISIDLLNIESELPSGIDEEAISDLAESIKEHGVIEPFVVRKNGEGYEIVAGKRRGYAVKKTGIKEVPVRIMED